MTMWLWKILPALFIVPVLIHIELIVSAAADGPAIDSLDADSHHA